MATDMMNNIALPNFCFVLQPETKIIDIIPHQWVQCDIIIGKIEITIHKFSLPWNSPKKIISKLKIFYEKKLLGNDSNDSNIPHLLVIMENHKQEKILPLFKNNSKIEKEHSPTKTP
jgi:hypothetical protein